MLTRRSVLQIMGWAGVLSATPGFGLRTLGAQSTACAATGTGPRVLAVASAHFMPGRAFAAAATHGGAEILAADRDLAPALGPLAEACARRPIVLIGLSQESTLMVVEHIALSAGLSPCHRGLHVAGGNGEIHHRFDAPSEKSVEYVARFRAADENWPGELAKMLLEGCRRTATTLTAVEIAASYRREIRENGRHTSPLRLASWAFAV